MGSTRLKQCYLDKLDKVIVLGHREKNKRLYRYVQNMSKRRQIEWYLEEIVGYSGYSWYNNLVKMIYLCKPD